MSILSNRPNSFHFLNRTKCRQFNTEQKEIHHYSLVLKVNDLTKPSFIVNIDSVQIAEDVVTSLDILVGNTKKIVAEETTQPEAPKEAPKLDKFDELKKYKELLDAGVITQEEFDKKKKELIG